MIEFIIKGVLLIWTISVSAFVLASAGILFADWRKQR